MKHVASRAALSTAGLAAQGLGRFIYTILVGRLIGEVALADVSALLSVSVWMALALPSGLGVAAARFLPTDEAGIVYGQLRTWFWIAGPTLAILSVPISYWLVEDVLSSVTCAILVLAYNAYVFRRGAMLGEDRLLRATVADLCSSLVAVSALLFVLLSGWSWATLLPLALGLGIFAFMSRPRTRVETGMTEERKSLLQRFVRDTVLAGLAIGGLLPTTMIFVRAFDDPRQAGIFAAALSLATPANMLAQAVNQVLIPHFARISGNPDTLIRTQRRMFFVSSLLFLSIFGAIIVLAPQILTILYGDRYAEGTSAMRLLLVIVMLISATSSPAALIVVLGRQRAYKRIWLSALILGAATMLGLSPVYGMWGALLGYAVGAGGGAVAVILYGNLARLPAHGQVSSSHAI